MKVVYIISLLTLLLLACNQKSETKTITNSLGWTQEEVVKYFKDSIANRMYNGTWGEGSGLNNFDSFSKQMFSGIKAKNLNDPLIFGFAENYIDTTSIPKNKKWLRITVDPCFRTPYCLILDQVNNKNVLIVKTTDGYGGYHSGYLNYKSSSEIDDTIFANIMNQLDQLHFWSISEDTTCSGGMDGEIWTIEAINKGKYNLIIRWGPQYCGNETTNNLAQIGIRLRKLTDLKKHLQRENKLSKEDIDRDYPDE